MRIVPIVALVSLACLAANGAIGAEVASVPSGYRLVWGDEFDGPALDRNEWTCRTGVSHESCQRPENISIENGAVRIALKKEAFGGKSFTGGGVITRRAYRYGYFETRAKMYGGQGWHEAFWTTFIDSLEHERIKRTKFDPHETRIEIDGFEHFAKHDRHTFSYGIIEWYPSPRCSISRDLAKVEPDLSEAFHTYGFEVAPDYINFYFDGELLESVDMRDIPWCPFYVWLSCIATAADADPEGACWFDYLRVYAIDPEAYAERRKRFLAKFEAEAGSRKSSGIDLWIEAERFANKGGWTTAWDQQAACLLGHMGRGQVKAESDREATTQIEIPQAGDYVLWVRSRDFGSRPGPKRTFRVAVGEQTSEAEFGAHGEDGWAWQKGGSFHVDAGVVTLRLIDTSAYYARCDKLLLTTDPKFTPQGKGGRSKVRYH